MGYSAGRKQAAALDAFHSVDRSCRRAEISDLAMQEKPKLSCKCCTADFLRFF